MNHNLSLKLGAGHDSVTITNVAVTGNVLVTAQGGNATFSATTLTVNGGLFMSFGAGFAEVALTGMARV